MNRILRALWLPSAAVPGQRNPVFPLLLVFCALLAWCSAANATTKSDSPILDQIRREGIITVGVKTDFPPLGMMTTSGEPEGLEVDLARDIARRLGVRLKTLIVTSENRFQKLEQGSVQLLIATAADTQERRRIATAIEPDYYAGGVAILLRPETRITDWQALRGQKICAAQGAYFNRPMSQRYLLDLEVFRSPRDALLALRDGRCIGFLYSSAAVQSYLKKAEWMGYKSPLPDAMVAAWAIYISRAENGTALEHIIGDIVAQWHRTGFLLDKEKEWGLQPSRFLQDAHDRWSQQDKSGNYLCIRGKDGVWPIDCRNSAFVRPDEVGGMLSLGIWLRESLGVDLTFIYDQYDRSLFVTGILYTLLLMGGAVFGSLLFGVLGALAVESGKGWLARSVLGLAIYGRMTPPLLQMYLLFFGVGSLLGSGTGIKLSPVLIAVLCLSYYTGAAVMNACLEAARHLRAHKPDFRLTIRNYRDISEYAAAPVTTALTNAVKQSILASALAIPELINVATRIMSDQGNINVMMNTFLLVFLLLIGCWMKFFNWAEHKLIASRSANNGSR